MGDVEGPDQTYEYGFWNCSSNGGISRKGSHTFNFKGMSVLTSNQSRTEVEVVQGVASNSCCGVDGVTRKPGNSTC